LSPSGSLARPTVDPVDPSCGLPFGGIAAQFVGCAGAGGAVCCCAGFAGSGGFCALATPQDSVSAHDRNNVCLIHMLTKRLPRVEVPGITWGFAVASALEHDAIR
jgi:hypothetical protein